MFRIKPDVKKIPSSEILRQCFAAAGGALHYAISQFNLLKKCRLLLQFKAFENRKMVKVKRSSRNRVF